MSALTPATGSPFDSIRRTRPDGTEYWSARDLMVAVAYDKWERFEGVIERARISAANQGHDADEAFSRRREEGTGGRPREDYELTRFAAYLVVMNGDPRKPEIAAAQQYFAIRTREAETRPNAHPELVSRSDLARMVLEAEEEKKVLESALESAAPAIAYHERYVSNDDVATAKTWGAQFGLTERQAYSLLVEKNIVYKHSIGRRWSGSKQKVVEEYEYRARAGRVTFAWFDLRPQHNAPRHHNGQVRQTLYVRQEHALDLGRKVGLSPIGAQGRLDIEETAP